MSCEPKPRPCPVCETMGVVIEKGEETCMATLLMCPLGHTHNPNTVMVKWVCRECCTRWAQDTIYACECGYVGQGTYPLNGPRDVDPHGERLKQAPSDENDTSKEPT